MMNKIYIGFDSKESIASDVCEFSLRKNCKNLLKISHLKLKDLRKKNIQKRR